MKRRLAILTEIIAPYRIPVFNALAKDSSVDPHVIFLSDNDPTLYQWPVYQNEIRFSYEVLPYWRNRLSGQNLLLNWGISAALRRVSPHALLCGGYNYLACWKAAGWARRHQVPTLVWVESTCSNQRSNQATLESLKRQFLQRCDAFVVPGKAASEYLKAYGINRETIFTAPNAVDSEFFFRRAEMVRKETSVPREALALPSRYFLSVGRLVKEKGVFDLLDAYAGLAPAIRDEVSLVFVGDGPCRSELSRKGAEIQPGRVECAGFAQREKLAAYYAFAEALVFPTRSDAWGMVVNEAMACGLPIISTSAAGCAADLVEDGWNGYMVPAGNVGRLSLAMAWLAQKSDLRVEMGAHSLQRIREFSPEICAEGIAHAVASLNRDSRHAA